MDCPVSPEELEAHAARELPRERSEEILSHLSGCSSCAEELGRIAKEDELLRAALVLPADPGARKSDLVARLRPSPARVWMSAGIAAAVVLTVSLTAAMVASLSVGRSLDPTTKAMIRAGRLLDEGRAREAAGAYEALAGMLARSGDEGGRLAALYGLGRSRLAEGNYLEAWVAFDEVAGRSADGELARKAALAGRDALSGRIEESGGPFERRLKEDLERRLAALKVSG